VIAMTRQIGLGLPAPCLLHALEDAGPEALGLAGRPRNGRLLVGGRRHRCLGGGSGIKCERSHGIYPQIRLETPRIGHVAVSCALKYMYRNLPETLVNRMGPLPKAMHLPSLAVAPRLPAMFEAQFQSFDDPQNQETGPRLAALRAELARRVLSGFI